MDGPRDRTGSELAKQKVSANSLPAVAYSDVPARVWPDTVMSARLWHQIPHCRIHVNDSVPSGTVCYTIWHAGHGMGVTHNV